MNPIESKWDKTETFGDRLKLQVMDFEVDPRSTSLLIIDMQKFGGLPNIALGKLLVETDAEAAKYWFSRLQDIVVPNIQKLLDFFRNNKLRVCFACSGPLLPDGSDLPPIRRHYHKWAQAAGSEYLWYPGTLEHEVIDDLKPRENEMIFNKNTNSAFNSTNINQILRNMGIESLVITGVATNACVETTSRDASDFGYKCILIADGCCAREQDRHDMTLTTFASIFGKVMYTTELINYLETKL